jgi:hypothetical protein
VEVLPFLEAKAWVVEVSPIEKSVLEKEKKLEWLFFPA